MNPKVALPILFLALAALLSLSAAQASVTANQAQAQVGALSGAYDVNSQNFTCILDTSSAQCSRSFSFFPGAPPTVAVSYKNSGPRTLENLYMKIRLPFSFAVHLQDMDFNIQPSYLEDGSTPVWYFSNLGQNDSVNIYFRQVPQEILTCVDYFKVEMQSGMNLGPSGQSLAISGLWGPAWTRGPFQQPPATAQAHGLPYANFIISNSSGYTGFPVGFSVAGTGGSSQGGHTVTLGMPNGSSQIFFVQSGKGEYFVPKAPGAYVLTLEGAQFAIPVSVVVNDPPFVPATPACVNGSGIDAPMPPIAVAENPGDSGNAGSDGTANSAQTQPGSPNGNMWVDSNGILSQINQAAPIRLWLYFGIAIIILLAAGAILFRAYKRYNEENDVETQKIKTAKLKARRKKIEKREFGLDRGDVSDSGPSEGHWIAKGGVKGVAAWHGSIKKFLPGRLFGQGEKKPESKPNKSKP